MKVTFSLPISIETNSVYLVGDFNSWDERSLPMLRTPERTWEITIELERNREYEYRYLVNEKDWHNDWVADDYRPNPFGSDNSVVSTTAKNK